ncbi:MAG TPA: E3 binding domain-containing protein, partial [Solirubrobacteraceae bacterium]
QARHEVNESDREYRKYVHEDEQDRVGPPDVLLDVPELRIDTIHFELDNLDAHVALKARVLNLVKLNVGVDVHLSRVKLDIMGVEAELVMKARLDHVTAIVDRLMTSLDRNPELVKGLSRAVSEVGKGAGEAVDKTGDAAKDIGRGAQSTLKDVGKGAGEATGDIGEGAGHAVGDLGQGAGHAVGEVGQGAGQAVGDIGQGAGQAVGDVGQGAGQAVGDVGHGAGHAVGDVGQGAGQAAGNLDQLVGGVGQTLGQAGQAVGGVTQGVGQAGQGAGRALGGVGQDAGQGLVPSGDGGSQQAQSNGGGPAVAKPSALAKEMAKVVAREIGHAASEEARDLGLAATRKVRELGERREQRRAEKYQATEAAVRVADELGIDLAELNGTGSEGRITVKDVREAQQA